MASSLSHRQKIVLLRVPCTLGELKKEATKAFADLYVILSKFKVTAIKGYENLPDSTRLNKNSLQYAHAEVMGEGADLESEYRYQGGLDQWVVNCHCGTNDDDGERMIACDRCEIWMHTRCVGIEDEAKTPKTIHVSRMRRDFDRRLFRSEEAKSQSWTTSAKS